MFIPSTIIEIENTFNFSGRRFKKGDSLIFNELEIIHSYIYNNKLFNEKLMHDYSYNKNRADELYALAENNGIMTE